MRVHSGWASGQTCFFFYFNWVLNISLTCFQSWIEKEESRRCSFCNYERRQSEKSVSNTVRINGLTLERLLLALSTTHFVCVCLCVCVNCLFLLHSIRTLLSTTGPLLIQEQSSDLHITSSCHYNTEFAYLNPNIFVGSSIPIRILIYKSVQHKN